ncbi:hypothetical protein BV898_12564 [Hypsibius exemplaris]|uniref:Uncharacterized protein n=1 Tax=Hypsibius exemplaris TaxID=2072580 RepID=A0A1W0WDF8_HYPEX|nr:hypothetical protein BV898_12564 [Hypsibius exemplaris]
MVRLAPHGEIAAADHPKDEVNYSIVRRKNSCLPDMVRVAYGSKYLEEKVFFWQGTEKIHGVHFSVQMIEAFCQRFEGFVDRFIRTESNVFGRVRDWWYRMETSNAAASTFKWLFDGIMRRR